MLGKTLVFVRRGKRLSGKIVEVEAYIGEDDPACHAAPGLTGRNAVMYGPPGYSYVYFIYGMYHCLNVVTEKKDFPAAILIRAAEPVEGMEAMAKTSPKIANHLLLSGPGRLCRSFGLTVSHSGLDLLGDRLFIEDLGEKPGEIVRTPRIGIRKAVDHLWRFIDAASPAVSGPRKK
ncbi:MAG: DNA-3-methyladenine glycosylase [candidate division Zixibacteria bacterium]|nr:DNA-3-methyladenine glycosylase [candidate division Zixibacteria bacterium]